METYTEVKYTGIITTTAENCNRLAKKQNMIGRNLLAFYIVVCRRDYADLLNLAIADLYGIYDVRPSQAKGHDLYNVSWRNLS